MNGVAGKYAPLSVMYVEDDPVTRALVAQTLPKKFPEFTIRTAENGKLGLQLYQDYQADIVITDVNMPVMNGILMAAEIKALNPDVVIIAVTAYSETNYLLNAIEIGISHYVLKPIDYKKLFEAIEKSSVGIRLRKQLAEQTMVISELNSALENHLSKSDTQLEALCPSISGDLTSSMAAIREYGQSVLQLGDSRVAERELGFVANIVQETERVDRLVQRLLQFTHVGSCQLSRSSVNLSGMAEEIADRLRQQEPQRQVTFRIAPDVIVDGDQRLLGIVLENLLEYAWQFTGKNPDPVIEFGAMDLAGAMTCFIKNNGVGEAPPLRCIQGVSTAEGDGMSCLGLATVQRILQLHGGTFDMAEEPGKGALFMFSV